MRREPVALRWAQAHQIIFLHQFIIILVLIVSIWPSWLLVINCTSNHLCTEHKSAPTSSVHSSTPLPPDFWKTFVPMCLLQFCAPPSWRKTFRRALWAAGKSFSLQVVEAALWQDITHFSSKWWDIQATWLIKAALSASCVALLSTSPLLRRQSVFFFFFEPVVSSRWDCIFNQICW